jgi:hypothetical protein
MKLAAETISTLLSSCLFKEDELVNGQPNPSIEMTKVEGLMRTFGFVTSRLKEIEPQILECINELDASFLESGGGGMSFLQLPFDKNGTQWGEQRNAEELFALASGLGHAKYLLPREMWQVLPGGVPYIAFNL